MDKKEIADSSKNKIEKMVQKKYGKKRTNEAFVYAKRIKAILEKMAVEGINDVSIKASILKIIDKRPEILMAQLGNHRYNLGMIAADLKEEWFVLKALDYQEASLQQDYIGENIGMHAAQARLERATLKALENTNASIQQSVSGRNIGMCAAENALEEATLKAIKNPVARSQKTYLQDTIKTIARGAGLARVVEAYDELAQNKNPKKKKYIRKEPRDLTIDEIGRELGL